MSIFFLWLICVAFHLPCAQTRLVDNRDEKILQNGEVGRNYLLEERIPVECLNRTSDTGEHVSTVKAAQDFS